MKTSSFTLSAMLAIGVGAIPLSDAEGMTRDVLPRGQYGDAGHVLVSREMIRRSLLERLPTLAPSSADATPSTMQPRQELLAAEDDPLDCEDADDDDDVPGGLPVPGKSTANGGKALYNGCYTESMRTLEGVQWNSETMTVDACAQFCAKDNWALFGVEYGGECFCGDKFKAPVSRAAEATCNMPCKGKKTDMCGGDGVISIWNNTAVITRKNKPTINNGKFAYAGCYTDNVNARAIDAARTADDKMTIEKCGTFCAGKGFKFMGVEYGKECFCNNEGPINKSAKVADGECSQFCAGDNTEFCGAPDRLTVYKAAK